MEKILDKIEKKIEKKEEYLDKISMLDEEIKNLLNEARESE